MKPRANILVIEDDKEYCQTLVKALSKEGYFVKGVNDARQALLLAKKEKYSIIIADVRLPGDIDGVEIVRRIKELSTEEISSIIITGYADESASIRAIDVKVDCYIKKPFELAYFLKKIKENLINLERERTDKSFIKDRKEALRKHDEWGKEDIDLKNKLCDLIVDVLCVEELEIKGDSNFQADLGADSIDMSELMAGIENIFKVEIGEDKASQLETVQDVFDYININK